MGLTFEVTCPPRAGGKAKMSEAQQARTDAVAGQVDRVVRPLAWIRLCSDGTYEGPIADCDSRMDGVRRTCGAWTPLYPPEALDAERERWKADVCNSLAMLRSGDATLAARMLGELVGA